MNILSKLSIESLKLNKKRTISTIIGIILSCSLICAVASMVTSFQETLIQNAINETGYYHISISNVAEKEIKDLKNNRDIKNVYTVYENGYGILKDSQNEDKPYLKLYSMSKDLFEYLKFDLIEGEFPKNDSEVIISKHIIDNGRVELKVGDKISIDVGQRKTVEGDELYPINLYQKEEEKIVDTRHKEFTIVGIIERPNYDFEAYSDPGYTIITTNSNIGRQNVYITLKNPREYKSSLEKLLGVSSYEEALKDDTLFEKLRYNIHTNDELLRWEAFAFGDETVAMLYTVVGIVIFIIIFTSVFCIRNSIAIATTEKMKMYGMLSSVGATKKQIRKNVIFESLLLGTIGIPLGILAGIFAVFVLIKIVNMIAGDYLLNNINGIIVKITILPIVISAILGIVTIYLSAISSAKKASKVLPIELLRNADEIKIKPKKLKVPKIISKLFKSGGEIAYKNLKRSRKKYRTTVISLAVSIFVFITMNTVITNMFDISNNYYKDYDYNIRLNIKEIEKEDIDKIARLDNIDECFRLYKSKYAIKIFDLSKINKDSKAPLTEDSYYDEQRKTYVVTGEGKRASLELLALDNESFIKFAKKIGVKAESIKEKGILCDKSIFYVDDKEIESRRYNYKAGDTIVGKLNGEEKTFTVGAVSEINPYGKESSNYSDGYFVVNLDEYKDINFSHENMLIQSSEPEKLVDEIKKLNISNMSVVNFDEMAKEQRSMNLIIEIFLYGFITVITLIGVTNIFNTITSNMELRQKEFAMLKSVGMTKKEFNRMINLETIFYCTKALIYGIILGLIGTYALYRAFSIKIEKTMYIPINPIIISIISVFVLVFIIMKYSMAKINKQNTIETIRNENI